MEHLNYACHPQEFFTKLSCFAHSIWAVAVVRRGRGGSTAGPGPCVLVASCPILSNFSGVFGLVVRGGRRWLSFDLIQQVSAVGEAQHYQYPEYGRGYHVCVLPVMYAVNI